MATTNTTPTVAAAAAAPKKKTAKKTKTTAVAGGTGKKVVKNKTAKKVAETKAAAKKTPAKKTPAAPNKKEGLRKPQVRVLEVLAKAGNRAMNRAEIAEKGSVDLAMLNAYIGSNNPERRAKNDKSDFVCLLTLGFVKMAPQEEEGRGTYYTITPAGKNALKAVAK